MAYLHALYSDLTGSPALPGGGALSVASLSRRAVRAGIVGRVEKSEERLSRLVDEDYLLVLHRHPDVGGAATYLAVLKSGISNEQVLIDLLESDEYLTDASRGTTPAH
jgi:hypothetical protein